MLRSLVTAIALCLAGRPGSRLDVELSICVAKDTLLELLCEQPELPATSVRVLGADDFAPHNGDSYATILVDLEARHPVHILPGRTAAAG